MAVCAIARTVGKALNVIFRWVNARYRIAPVTDVALKANATAIVDGKDYSVINVSILWLMLQLFQNNINC